MLTMKEQTKKLPKCPLWHEKDLCICFLIGLAVGLFIGWLAVHS